MGYLSMTSRMVGVRIFSSASFSSNAGKMGKDGDIHQLERDKRWGVHQLLGKDGGVDQLSRRKND
jgi:hypothetical protein